jgi:glycosyltransferase involved in cell wall biosynthesis
MKIVHVYKDFYPPLPAGVTGYLRDVADEQARRGHDVEVHVAGVRRPRTDVMSTGVVVRRHRELGRALSSPLAPGLAFLPLRHADVLHVHMPNPLAEIGIFVPRRKPRVPVVVSFHAQLGRQRFMEPVYGPLRRASFRRAAAVLVSSQIIAEARELEAAAGKIVVLPYGVSPRMIVSSSASRSADGPLRVLFVGRLVYYKGVDVLLRALAGLDQITLTLVGDGVLRAQLEELAGDLGLSSRVRFVGTVDDDELRDLYASHDVLVLPSVSRAEAFGLVMSEAMLNGLPIISTSLGTGTDWVNKDGESGFVVAPGDVEALATALSRLGLVSERQRLAAGARARAARLFSFSAHVDELERVYATVARNARN